MIRVSMFFNRDAILGRAMVQKADSSAEGCHYALSHPLNAKRARLAQNDPSSAFCFCPDVRFALPVHDKLALAALKLYFYHNYTYRFLFQFSIYSFCLVQFHALLCEFPMIVVCFPIYRIQFKCFCLFVCKSATLLYPSSVQNWEMLQLLCVVYLEMLSRFWT